MFLNWSPLKTTIFDVVNKREERKVTAYYKGGALESDLNLISLKVRAFPFIWEAGSLSVSQREKNVKLRQLQNHIQFKQQGQYLDVF